MPELPEVETIASGLRPRLIGRKIVRIDVYEDRTIVFDRRLITEVVAGYKISSIRRRAKVLIWDLDSGYSLLFHLKMTGQMVLQAPSIRPFAGGHPTKSAEIGAELPDKSTRVVFYFDDDMVLYFNDQRKFGWIKLLPTKAVHLDSFIKSIGPEPDDKDSFTPTYLWQKVKNRITPIKAMLLDQTIVAGIGNIYADEALHMAKIHPARKASSLLKGEVAALFNAIIVVLKNGIEQGGTSFTNYVNAMGHKGGYQDQARVFRRDGQNCFDCGDVILKTKVAGRGTHYCPTCQILPGNK